MESIIKVWEHQTNTHLKTTCFLFPFKRCSSTLQHLNQTSLSRNCRHLAIYLHTVKNEYINQNNKPVSNITTFRNTRKYRNHCGTHIILDTRMGFYIDYILVQWRGGWEITIQHPIKMYGTVYIWEHRVQHVLDKQRSDTNSIYWGTEREYSGTPSFLVKKKSREWKTGIANRAQSSMGNSPCRSLLCINSSLVFIPSSHLLACVVDLGDRVIHSCFSILRFV